MNDWFIFSIIALLMWGFWGFFPKLATGFLHPLSAMVFEVAGTVIVGILVLFILGFKPELYPKGIGWAILTGIVVTLGTLFFFYAISRGKASVVVAMTALYPLVSILLSFLILKSRSH